MFATACSAGGGSSNNALNSTTGQGDQNIDPSAKACVAGQTIPNCVYPAPAAPYPSQFGNPTQQACGTQIINGVSITSVPVIDGYNGDAESCVNYLDIFSLAQGNYAAFGTAYFSHFPLYISPDCPTPIQYEGQTINVCF